MLSADKRGWGKGWPTDRSADQRKVTGAGITLTVHKRIAGLVGWLLNETERVGYDLHAGECWGYASRPIRGSRKPSNHSWGLAVDLNAPANPMGDRLVTDIPAAVVDLWETHGFAWGGDYQGRKDAMHFEFSGTPSDADRISATVWAKATAPTPTPTPAPAPAPAPTRQQQAAELLAQAGNLPVPLTPGTDQFLAVVWLQRALNLLMPGGAQLDTTGVYDQRTANHVAVWQQMVTAIQPGAVAHAFPGAVNDQTKFWLAVGLRNIVEGKAS